MPRKQNRLSVVFCKQQNLQPGLYCDGLGLCLQASIYVTKSWPFRYSRGGRERKMGLGAFHTIGLAEARQSALECRKLLLQGVDPIEVKRAQSAKQPTFAECAAQYIEAHSKTWKSAIHAEQWPQTLAAYVYPYFGDLPVDRIETTHGMRR
jgi:hypothetical protein